MNKWTLQFVLLFVFSQLTVGCASFGKKLKSFLSGQPDQQQANKPTSSEKSFTQNSNYMPGPKRQYRRVTKQTLEEEAQLDGQSGSLWVMEGQGSYLFSQNIMRMIGDPIGVKVEGEAQEQLEAKVDVIGKLLTRLDERNSAPRDLASADKDKKPDKDKKAGAADPAQPPAAAPQPKEATADNKDTKFNVKTIPARIVERMVDGNYRVKGSQPFMIGKREYKVIVTGVVRAEDFADEGISASQLIDPKFDVVSAKRKEMSL